METPIWALTLAYWLHMTATVVWIGALATLALLIIPLGQRVLTSTDFAQFIATLQRRLDPLAWFSLSLLVATGLVQMAANPNYQGFLTIEGRWAQAILLKHLMFGGMILTSAYLTWWVLPQLRRAAFRQARGENQEPEWQTSRRQQIALVRLNLVLSVIILALTALARTS